MHQHHQTMVRRNSCQRYLPPLQKWRQQMLLLWVEAQIGSVDFGHCPATKNFPRHKTGIRPINSNNIDKIKWLVPKENNVISLYYMAIKKDLSWVSIMDYVNPHCYPIRIRSNTASKDPDFVQEQMTTYFFLCIILKKLPAVLITWYVEDDPAWHFSNYQSFKIAVPNNRAKNNTI